MTEAVPAEAGPPPAEAAPAFHRVLLKLSGEAMMGEKQYGLDPERIGAIASERAIYEHQPDVQSKPEEVRGKIVEGRLRKEFLATIALSEQPWIHDPSLTTAKALEEAGLDVLEFVRYALPE